MPKHRYFYIENGQRKEELVAGKWVKAGERDQSRAHNLIRDDLGTKGVYNPATKRKYDSKSRYYADTKAAGCSIVGNDQAMNGPPRTRIKEPFEQTIERLNQQKGWNL